MNIQDAAKIINKHKRGIATIKVGDTILQNELPTSIDSPITEYLTEIAEMYPNDVIDIVFRASNGSSYREGKKFAIIPQQQATKVQQQATKLQQTSNKIATNKQQIEMNSNPNFINEFIIQDLKEKNSELKVENKQLQQENKQLLKENNQLEKRLELQEKDFLIEKLENDSNSKAGLNGFIESAAENPAMMNVVATVLGRVLGTEFPAMQPQTAIEQPKEAATFEIKTNSNYQKLIDYTTDLIEQLSDEEAQIFATLMKEIATNKEVLKQIVEI